MIVHFVYNLDSYSGAAQQAQTLASSIKIRKIFFNYGSKSGKEKHNVEVINVNGFFSSIWSLFKVCGNEENRIFHLHGFFPLALIFGYLFRKKLILKTTMLGGDDFSTFANSLKGRVKLFIAQLADINVVLTSDMLVANSQFFRKEKIVLIPNGVVVDQYVQLVPKDNWFCFSGLVCARKRPDLAILFFKRCFSELPGARLFICGPGESSDFSDEYSSEYIDFCKDMVGRLGLVGKVEFTGYLDKNNLFSILKRSKAILFFSEKEGMSNAVLEAMANNCVPIVSRQVSAFRDVLGDELEQFMIDSELDSININDIDSAILGRIPFRRIEFNFKLNTISMRYESLYAKLLKND